MIEEMEKGVFYSTYVICYCFMYLTILATQQCSRITNSDVIIGVMREKDRRVAAAGQPGDRLCKQTLGIAALDCVACCRTPSLISVEAGWSGRQPAHILNLRNKLQLLFRLSVEITITIFHPLTQRFESRLR